VTAQRDRLRFWLSATWWLIVPAFALLSSRLAIERGCGDPHYLLPELMARPGWALTLVAAYMLAHLWMLTTYLMTALASDRLLPAWRDWRALWRTDLWQVGLMIVALAIEHAPMTTWRIVGPMVACRSPW